MILSAPGCVPPLNVVKYSSESTPMTYGAAEKVADLTMLLGMRPPVAFPGISVSSYSMVVPTGAAA